MDNLYWVGLNESEIEFCKNIFKKSITINGNGNEDNISFSNRYSVRKNYHDDFLDIIEFYNDELNRICDEDSNAKFMFYSPYMAYTLGAKITERTICLNSFELISKIKNKFEMRKWVKEETTVKTLPNIFLKGTECSYDLLKNIFQYNKNGFVIQKEISDGGNGTILMTANNHKKIILDDNETYSISEYLKNAASFNSTLIIYDNDICFFPSSIQIVSKDLNYKGADFIAFNDLPEHVQLNVNHSNYEIGSLLKNAGFRGICGIDYLWDGNNVYFMEVNERFQASTYLINMSLYDNQMPSAQSMCIDAFNHKLFCQDITNFEVCYSNYAYSYNSDNVLSLYDKLPFEQMVTKVVNDGFYKGMKLEKNSFLFKLIFSRKISEITPDKTLRIFDNISCEHNIDISNAMDVKIALMCSGIFITKKAQEMLLRQGGVCESISNGINITIFDNMTVSCYSQVYPTVALSPFTLDYADNKYILLYYDEKVSYVKMQFKLEIMKNITKNKIPYRSIALLALDRVSLNYHSDCIFKKENLSCRFCGITGSTFNFSLDDIFEVIDAYLNNVSFEHFLIGGPVENIQKDLKKINTIASYISTNCNKSIYLMTLPIDNLNDLKQLRNNGITEIAFNIEVFDRELAKDIMPGKGKIPLEKYYRALENATKVWTELGAVRSMVVVGLERRETLLKGIEKLAQMGVSPILSPFGPAKNSLMENSIPTSFEYLKDVYYEAKDICKKHGISLGPKCNVCRNNTLS